MSGRVGSITTDIIADGLVFNMDAANRASTKPISTITTSFNTIDTSISGAFSDNGIFDSSTISPSYAFGGTDDVITIYDGPTSSTPSIFKISATDSFTYSFWIKTDSQTSNRYFFTSRGDASDMSNRAYNSLYLSWSSGNNAHIFYIYFRDDNNNVASTNSTLATSGHVADNTWANVVGLADRSTNLATLYINGVQGPTVSISSLGAIEKITDVSLGNDPFGSGRYWYIGNMGNAHIYNRALSSTEVKHNYNALKGRFGL